MSDRPGPSVALVWYRRDLRLADNPALLEAVERCDAVVPVYIHAPHEEAPWSPGAASRWWLHHSLGSLDAGLRRHRNALCLRAGDSLEALLALARETGATHVFWNRLYEPAAVERDARIKTALRAAGIDCNSFNAALLHEPWEIRTEQKEPYRVFTPFWRACQRGPGLRQVPAAAPRKVPAPARAPRSLSLEELQLLPRIRWDAGIGKAWQPGETQALARLESFAAGSVRDYHEQRDRPDVDGVSRLSPHLHFGELSPRQCVAAMHSAVAQSPALQPGAEAFVRELGWREFAHHLLFHFPQTTGAPLDARFARFPWRNDSTLLDSWRRGQTGFPIVDAGMRELWSTGWMHNRVRMIVASLLTKNLGVGWLEGARWFWDTLVDADLANNTLGWQWTAGCGADAAPFFRIFNPVLQAERCDPLRRYIRQWVPEIAALPDKLIHQPWTAPVPALEAAGVGLGRTYPHPVVDLQRSRAAALASYQSIRATVGDD